MQNTETQARHTPGPWYFESDGEGSPSHHWDKYICGDNGGGRVCTMHRPSSGSQQEERANARLIAEAPAMLDCLQKAAIDLTALLCSRSLDSTRPEFHTVRRIRDRIKTIITDTQGGAA